VDYFVFTDAADYVAQGKSPYERATYRYTPLLAYMLTPSIWTYRWVGKVIFVIADLKTGDLIHEILQMKGTSKKRAAVYSGFWLLNPFVANISTRGSSEGLLAVFILLFLRYLIQHQVAKAGIIFGLAVHFKIYPIIYALPAMIFLHRNNRSYHTEASSKIRISKAWYSLTESQLVFFLTSAGSFMGLGNIFYLLFVTFLVLFNNVTYIYIFIYISHFPLRQLQCLFVYLISSFIFFLSSFFFPSLSSLFSRFSGNYFVDMAKNSYSTPIFTTFPDKTIDIISHCISTRFICTQETLKGIV